MKNIKITLILFCAVVLSGFYFKSSNAAQCQLTGASLSRQIIHLDESVGATVTGSDCAGTNATVTVRGRGMLGSFVVKTFIVSFDANPNTATRTISFDAGDIATRTGDVSIFIEVVTEDGTSKTSSSGSIITRVPAAVPGAGTGPAREPDFKVQVFGQDSGTPFSFRNPLMSKTILGLLDGILELAMWIGIPIAVIMILYSGIMFLFSQGSSGVLTKARSILQYAIIGLAVILVGKGFLTLIQSILDLANR